MGSTFYTQKRFFTLFHFHVLLAWSPRVVFVQFSARGFGSALLPSEPAWCHAVTLG